MNGVGALTAIEVLVLWAAYASNLLLLVLMIALLLMMQVSMSIVIVIVLMIDRGGSD